MTFQSSSSRDLQKVARDQDQINKYELSIRNDKTTKLLGKTSAIFRARVEKGGAAAPVKTL